MTSLLEEVNFFEATSTVKGATVVIVLTASKTRREHIGNGAFGSIGERAIATLHILLDRTSSDVKSNFIGACNHLSILRTRSQFAEIGRVDAQTSRTTALGTGVAFARHPAVPLWLLKCTTDDRGSTVALA
ncbi:hypothetical protein FRC17_005039 [Serendipita sp. 399]|nr:hypothetical protein FRC17_005039 [Serendipita sp. 399]